MSKVRPPCHTFHENNSIPILCQDLSAVFKVDADLIPEAEFGTRKRQEPKQVPGIKRFVSVLGHLNGAV